MKYELMGEGGKWHGEALRKFCCVLFNVRFVKQSRVCWGDKCGTR
jgi:hypothetical protein